MKKLTSIVGMGLLSTFLFTTAPIPIFNNYMRPTFEWLSNRVCYPSIIFEWLAYSVGVFFTWVLVIRLFAWLVHRAFMQSVDSRVQEMPTLQPLPIPTRNRFFFARTLVWLVKSRKWELVKEYRYEMKDKTVLIVPKGFKFDGASIPRPLWPLLSPTGLFLIPGLFHDYAYRHDKLHTLNPVTGDKVPFQSGAGRLYWDNLFFKLAVQVNGLWTVSALAWLAVVCGGIGPWNSHRCVKKSRRDCETVGRKDHS